MSINSSYSDNIMKVIEISTVTDSEIERIINKTQREGWLFEDIKFVMREASKRPSMAFLFFNKPNSPKSE